MKGTSIAHQATDRCASIMAEVERYAAKRGGSCVSQTYRNAHTKLTLICRHGHKWQATWSNLSRGQWCPLCRRRKAASHRRLSIATAQQAAQARGGRCVSKRYVDNRTHLLWRCGSGHQWKARLDQVRGAGTWCPECARLELSKQRKDKPPPVRSKVTIDDLHRFARQAKGKCLTDSYVNQRQLIDWECKRGHRFRSSWVNTITRDNYCPMCAESARRDNMLRRARSLAIKARGRCLSRTYEEARSPLKWECRAGHHFKESWANISNRSAFCPRC